MNFFFRVDSNFEIGNGHFSRCLTLAKEISSHKNNLCFFLLSNTDNLIKKEISKYNFKIINIPNFNKKKDDASFCNSLLNKFNNKIIIKDNYLLDYSWEKEILNQNNQLVVIDDYLNKKHISSIYINFCFSSNYAILKKKINLKKNSKVLLGPKYAIIDEKFKDYKPVFSNELKSIFIFFGSSDKLNLSLLTLKSLSVKYFEQYKINIITTTKNTNLNKLRKFCNDKSNMKLTVNTNNIAKYIHNTSFCIVSGGVITWEKLFFLKPSLVFITSKDQYHQTYSLKKLKYHIIIYNNKLGIESLRDKIIKFNESEYKTLKLKEIVDGDGAKRIYKSLVKL